VFFLIGGGILFLLHEKQHHLIVAIHHLRSKQHDKSTDRTPPRAEENGEMMPTDENRRTPRVCDWRARSPCDGAARAVGRGAASRREARIGAVELALSIGNGGVGSSGGDFVGWERSQPGDSRHSGWQMTVSLAGGTCLSISYVAAAVRRPPLDGVGLGCRTVFWAAPN
jgi:hypothetical protein